jgi:hypothetical protein
MKAKGNTPEREQTGVDDVRRVRERIAAEHQGDLAAHLAETNRIADEARERLGLGPVVKPPAPSRPGAASTPA